MKRENRELLINGLDILGISYEEDAIDSVERYISLYCDWNKNINLSSIREERDIIIRHILDSVSIIPFVDNIWGKSCVDLGSGGGLPGVPLKIFNPRVRIDFSEVSKKKNLFLKEVISALFLSNSKIVDSSIGKVEQRYNVIFCRAFGNLAQIVEEGKKYLRLGRGKRREKGKIIAYKGKKVNIDREIHELRPKYKKKIDIIKIVVPFLEEERYIVVINL